MDSKWTQKVSIKQTTVDVKKKKQTTVNHN